MEERIYIIKTLSRIALGVAQDIAFWSYLANALVAMYGFVLFTYWWCKVGDASNVYKYITALMAAVFIVYGGNIHMRVLLTLDPIKALEFSGSFIWIARTWFEGVILLIIVYTMTTRITRTIKSIRRFRVEEPEEKGKFDV